MNMMDLRKLPLCQHNPSNEAVLKSGSVVVKNLGSRSSLGVPPSKLTHAKKRFILPTVAALFCLVATTRIHRYVVTAWAVAHQKVTPSGTPLRVPRLGCHVSSVRPSHVCTRLGSNPRNDGEESQASNNGLFGAIRQAWSELDAFMDDASARRLGAGATFYGKRKSNFYGATDRNKKIDKNIPDPLEDYQGPTSTGLFRWMPDEEGQLRPVTRGSKQTIIERNPSFWDRFYEKQQEQDQEQDDDK
jgi:hypothetical protein